MIEAKVLDLSNLPEHGIIFADRRFVRAEDMRTAFKDVPHGRMTVIFVDDLDVPLLNIASEADMNDAGWFRMFS